MRHPATEPVAFDRRVVVGTGLGFDVGHRRFSMPTSQGGETRTVRSVMEKAQKLQAQAVGGRKRHGLADGQRPEKTLLLCADPHLRGRHDSRLLGSGLEMSGPSGTGWTCNGSHRRGFRPHLSALSRSGNQSRWISAAFICRARYLEYMRHWAKEPPWNHRPGCAVGIHMLRSSWVRSSKPQTGPTM